MENILEKKELSRYIRVYTYYKELILSEKLLAGNKLPSIRKAAQQFQMSRTTMESAYLLLAAEGYIISKPQSGYYVTNIAQKKKKQVSVSSTKKEQEEQKIRYDFVTSSVDRESFKFEVWRRYMKSALRQDERLLSYGEPQGEQDFREVLCEYLKKERSVVCNPDQIVIGAGVQSLLNILCPLLSERRQVCFYNKEFLQGCAVFEDYGFEFKNNLQDLEQGVYYVSPSQMTKWGGVMSIKERLNLIQDASERGIYIIEDDYNSEFRYFQRPTPSLQGLAGGRGVIYLGTFSKMLLPSIRMSFMILPPELIDGYEKRKNMYNQTASKAEQIAITQFIRDGHLASQIRKSRKIHLAKAMELTKVIKRIFGTSVKAEVGEMGFHVYLYMETEKNLKEVVGMAKKKGIAVMPQPYSSETGEKVIMLNCANVAVEDYEAAMVLLKECL